VYRHRLLARGAAVGLHDDHLTLPPAVGDVEQVGPAPLEQPTLTAEQRRQLRLLHGRVEVAEALDDAGVA
jgi:hypothetical protein